MSASASAAFLVHLGLLGVEWPLVLALLLGGIVAAPIAAWLVSRIPARTMGIAVGGLIIMTNLNTLLAAGGIDKQGLTLGFAGFVAVWFVLVIAMAVRESRVKKAQAEALAAAEAEWSI